ncbi:unnamed protein product [Thlaspi arvense]|uniref:Uncharacterized protein n=1 Tax=Thlaspi arvense TaxID=13288 RepID=A0AAU9RFB9_THLAR|nr:unnamed protein product [Thlaspi arvense]
MGRLLASGLLSKMGGNEEWITIVNKGTPRNFERIKTTLLSIDLSNNGFKGRIPKFLKNFKGLQSLNLSNNELDGPIPSSLVQLMTRNSKGVQASYATDVIPTESSIKSQTKEKNAVEISKVTRN